MTENLRVWGSGPAREASGGGPGEAAGRVSGCRERPLAGRGRWPGEWLSGAGGRGGRLAGAPTIRLTFGTYMGPFVRRIATTEPGPRPDGGYYPPLLAKEWQGLEVGDLRDLTASVQRDAEYLGLHRVVLSKPRAEPLLLSGREPDRDSL